MDSSIKIITSAFNNLKQYADTTFVIQCEGRVLLEDHLLTSLAEDISALQNAGLTIIKRQDIVNPENDISYAVMYHAHSGK